jgi:hypothetical protein
LIARHALRFALATAAAFAALSAPAFASDDAWSDVEVIADDEMDDLRGGFEIPGTSINVNFGAVVTTVMNGIPVLTTNVTWTDAGAIVDRTMANVGESLSEMPPEAIEALGLDGLQDAGGLVIEDEAGVTAIVHNITESSIQNIIVNNATGRDIAQDIDVTLTLPGFEYVQQQIATERFGIRIGEDLSNVMIGLE